MTAATGGLPGADAPAECPVCSVDPEGPSDRVGADGRCESCGRAVPAGRDHLELDLGQLAGVTDRGLRHERNEDAMALATVQTPAGPAALAVISDGVSTAPQAQQGSQVAAQAAARLLLTSLRRGEEPAEASRAAVRQAHLALSSLGSPGRSPSATYVSAVAVEGALTVCWLGDSRAYWLQAGPGSRRLTADDSLAEEMVARGELAEADALASPQAHVITRWLGAEGAEPRAHLIQFEAPGPGVVLICSDGLWNYLPEAAALAELALPAALSEPLAVARTLLSFAIGAGGADNITAVLIPLPQPPPAGI